MRRRFVAWLWIACSTCAGAAELSSGRAALIRRDPAGARGHVEQARLRRLTFDRKAALQHLSEAFALAPDDPVVLREYAAATPDARLEIALSNRMLRSALTPDQWKAEASSRLGLLRKLDGRAVNQLKSPYVPYGIRMPVVHSRESRPMGWLLSVRIQDGRPLRLMFDTGSRGILIPNGEAAKLDLEPLGESAIGGFGNEAPRPSKLLLARSVQVGELQFANVIVEASTLNLPSEFDGLIGPDLFRQFQMTLNGPKKLLRLEPFAGTDPGEGAGERPWPASAPDHDAPTLMQAGHLLVAPAKIAGNGALFVLDSGAAFSLLQTVEKTIALRTASLEGISGSTGAALLPMAVQVQIGGYRGWIRDAVSTDLAPISERFGIPITGFLGFPALSRAATTLDLRDGKLSISEAATR